MDAKKRQPLGIELVKRGIVTENDIQRALDYQKAEPKKKIGDILNILRVCDPYLLIDAMGEILEERAIYLKEADLKVNLLDYLSLDIAKQYKAIPFEEVSGRIKVCFADTSNRRAVETVRLLLLNKGLIMEKYITFETNIDLILNSFMGSSEKIDVNADVSGFIDSVIKTAMDKRASDIHIEPMQEGIRVRYRIDGQLVNAANIGKEKQAQIVGRLKAISNMHQEKQESQDGRIIMYPDYNIRVSSQKNIYGEKFVLRLLKKNEDVKSIFELGFREDKELLKNAFNKKNSITVIAAPTGEGKTTTLYSIIDYLNKPEINITTIEDPVEIRINGLNQIETDTKTTFADSLRTVLRQDPDIILVGEIRDKETAEIAMQAGQTGHYVLSTIHTIDAVEVITRLRKMGVSNYDISSTLATSVSQRLVRRLCKNCAKEREYTDEEKNIMTRIAEKYGQTIDFTGKKTYEAVGCKKCNNTGFYGRIGIFEVMIINDETKSLIANNASILEIRNEAIKNGYVPLVMDGISRILDGTTNLQELNNKLALY